MATRDITVRDMLHRAAAWSPERESLVDELLRYTYPQLLDQVQYCASLYHQLGVRKGDRVALMTASSVQALFATIELGAIPTSLHVRESVGNLSAALEQLSPRIPIDKDRYVYLRGRLDDMIISGGMNILPSAVEDAVMSHEAVSEAAVIGLPDEEWTQRVIAFVVKRSEITAEKIDGHVRQSDLAEYARPREYRFIDELPKGNTGKVSRKALREPWNDDGGSRMVPISDEMVLNTIAQHGLGMPRSY